MCIRDRFWNPDQARERLGFILDLSADLHIVTVFDAGPAAVARFVQQTRWKAKDSENTLRSTETCFRAMLAARPDRVTQCDMTAVSYTHLDVYKRQA